MACRLQSVREQRFITELSQVDTSANHELLWRRSGMSLIQSPQSSNGHVTPETGTGDPSAEFGSSSAGTPQYSHSLTWNAPPDSPAPGIASGESLVTRAAYEYLSQKQCVLWQGWMISHEPTRLEAARWLAEQFSEVDALLRRANL